MNYSNIIRHILNVLHKPYKENTDYFTCSNPLGDDVSYSGQWHIDGYLKSYNIQIDEKV